MSFGITELVIILVIVLLLFGTSKLKSIGTDLGSAIKGFKSAVTDEEQAGQAEKEKIAEAKPADARTESKTDQT